VLPQGLTVDERPELLDERLARAEGEIRVDSGLERGETELLEPLGLGVREALPGDVGQRRAPPQRETPAEGPPGPGRVPVRERGPPVRKRPLEPDAVQLIRPDSEDVARGTRRDPAVLAQRPAQLGNVDLEQPCAGGRPARHPHRVDQCVDGDDRVRVQEEEREQRAQFRGPDANEAVGADHLERPENAELHRRLLAATLYVRRRSGHQVRDGSPALHVDRQ
jgi:hypothetical protein